MIVVTGVGGQLGTAFRRVVPEARFLTRSDLDLETADQQSIREAVGGADLVINCAAYTAVDKAEDDQETAERVNATAVGLLAGATAAEGSKFVTYSTDYVFAGDGTAPYLEDDPTDPINVYGATKLNGEKLAQEANPESLVIRTSWVLSPTHPNFVSAIVGKAKTGPLKVVNDQTGSPTMVDDLAVATMEAVDADVSGLLHLTNSGVTTWFDLAREAVALADLDPDLVSPCSTEEFPTRAKRPEYSVLGSSVREEVGISELPGWRESLEPVVEGLFGG